MRRFLNACGTGAVVTGMQLLLVACSFQPASIPPIDELPTGISGEAARVIEGVIENPEALSLNNLWAWALEEMTISAVVAGGVLNPDGSFKVSLPEVAPSILLATLSDFCSSGLMASPSEARVMIVPLVADTVGTYVLHTTSPRVLSRPRAGDQITVRIYVDNDTSISGSCTRGPYHGLSLDLHLQRGWNLAVFEITAANLLSQKAAIRSSVPSHNARWYAQPDAKDGAL